MKFPETEFFDITHVAKMYDSSRGSIKQMLVYLADKQGYVIPVVRWGTSGKNKSGKIKVHEPSFRKAMLQELSVRAGEFWTI